MDLSDAVPTTPEFLEAKEVLTLRARVRAQGLTFTKPKELPALTERECIRLAQDFDDVTIEQIRRVFPVRSEQVRAVAAGTLGDRRRARR